MKIYSSSHIDLKLSQIGGKAFNLYRLKKYGFNVPDFVVIDQNELTKSIPAELKNQQNYSKIAAYIDEVEINQSVLDEVSSSIENAQDKLFAIRSSAVQEDGKQFSFAGQFESYLYVRFEDIPSHLKMVWKSNFSHRVEEYQKNNHLESQYGIGVIIQEMIDADVSGVGFGINPNTGIPDSKVICSVFGVGEGIVSGELNSDTFNMNGDSIESILVNKPRAAQMLSSGKIDYTTIEEEKQDLPSLTDNQLSELKTILNELENKIGSPQDIEFALKDEVIHLLQTRPITAINKSKFKHDGKNRIIWDNSNIIESYPGVTTPLTFSYILDAYRQVYMQLALIFGVSKKKVAKNKGTFEHMIGLINGRVYYNLFSWYRMLALFPGYRLNARFMETMMGVKERFDLPKEDDSSKIIALFRTLLMGARIIGHMFSIKRQTKQYLKDVSNSIAEYKQLDLEKMSAFEIKEKWIEIEAYLTSKWRAPILTDSFAMFYFGKLQRQIEKYKISDNPNLHNDLLCGSQDIISVVPIHKSIALSTEISNNGTLKSIFTEHPPEEIWGILQSKEHVEFLSKVNAFIEEFGDRCVGELKLETISYKQEPSMFIATLKSFVIQKVTTSSSSSDIDQNLRLDAEKEVKKALKNKPIKRFKLKTTIKKTRYLVSNRENLRFERTRVFGLTREMFTQIGREFEKSKVLNSYRDIFYLTKEEIFGFIEASSVDTDLISLTDMRKKEYQKYEEMEEAAERFTTFDAVNMGNDFFNTSIENILDGELSGVGCCPGIVKAKVRLVKHPKEVESLNGDILVTSSTDPGWVTLFPTASAIIVERGSLLSHSAIVSREMGIPCIVGVTGLLKTLKTGDLVEMDGSTGAIKIITDGE